MSGYPWFNYGYPERYAGKIIDIHNWIVGVNIWLDYGYPYCRGSYILKLNCGCPIIKLWIGVIRHHYTYPWLSIIMDAHDRSQQNTWKLFETLSVLMSYRKYNTIILDCLSKLRIMDLLRCDTVYLKNFHDSSDICPMGFIYSIQICEISHQTFGPSHRKCPTCPMIFMNTGDTMTNGVKKIRSHWWKFD